VFFGSLDLMKFRSSLTLFELASEKNPAIVAFIEQRLSGERDEVTLAMLKEQTT